MKIESLIKEMSEKITLYQSRLEWLQKHRETLEVIKTQTDAVFYSGGFDFDSLPHDEIVKVIKVIGGTWKKEPCGHDKINYIGMLDGVTVRCWAGEPPPSCKIISEEVLIPAQKVIRQRLVCKEDYEPAVSLDANSGGE